MAVDEWKPVRLGELISIKHGWPFKSELFSEELTGKPIIVSIGNFQYTGGFRFETTTLKEYRGDYPPEFVLKPGDTLLVMTCQTAGGEILGIPGRIPNDNRLYLHNQRMGKVVITDPVRINDGFLYWLFLAPDFNRELFVTASGTKILHTSPSRIEAYTFRLPPIPEQHAIADILGTLDDKIELNRRMNETLEAMARGLFKQWFVDEAEEGWETGKFGDIAENIRRGAQPNEIEPETPYIGLEHMPRQSIALAEWGQAEQVTSNKFWFKRGEILFGKLRPYFHKVGVAPIDGVCSTDILVIAPKSPEWFGLALSYLSSDALVAHTNTSSTGTRMPRTNWEDIARYEILVPPLETAQTFSQHIMPIVEKILANIFQSRTLAALRDALLPKLLSGEVRVGDVEAQFIAAKHSPGEEARAEAYRRHLRPNDRYRRR